MVQKFNSASTPAVLKMANNEYKVSPYGPRYPDASAEWTDGAAAAQDAQAEALRMILEPREELAALKAALGAFAEAIRSEGKAGVAFALSQMMQAAEAAGVESAQKYIDGSAPVRG